MVLAVEQPTLDINAQISALQTQEELLHKSLDNLRGDRKTVKEYRTCDKELAEVTRRRKALEALAQFEVGSLVYKPGTTLSGTITEIRITPGGLGEVWVSWDSGISIPEQPMNIKYAIACEHKFRGIWQPDGTLIGYCDCGIMRSPTRELLAHHLDNCRKVRCDYAEKVVDGQPQNFVQAVERIDRQIQWLSEHLLQQSSNVGETPAPDKCGNTHIDNAMATPVHHSVVAPEVSDSGDQQPLPTPEIQERLIDVSTGGDDTRLLSLEDDKAQSFFDSELVAPKGTEGDKAHQVFNFELVDPKGNEYLALEFIAIDGGTQSRACLNDSTVDEYAEAMDNSSEFPPILVFYDGEKYWLADGFHRVAAAKKLELSEIAATIRKGTRRDAVLYSVGANATHGLRRTNADKRRGVLTLLGDEEWSQWSNNQIAKQIGVAEGLVRKIKEELSSYNTKIDSGYAKKCGSTPDILESVQKRLASQSDLCTTSRSGNAYTINTSNIGNKSSLKGKVRITDQESQPEPEDIVNESLAKMQEVTSTVESVTQTTPAIIADDVTIGLISNVEILSNEQLRLVLKTVETELSKRNPIN